MANILLPKDDVHLRLGIIKEARAAGLDWLSQAFLIYQKIRWYETDGKFGFMVASSEVLGAQFGLTARQTAQVLEHLRNLGLIQHIWCDKKIYRNKTKVWMSTVRLRGVSTSVEAIKVIGCGKKNINQLEVDPFELKKMELLAQSESDGSECESDGSDSESDGSDSESDGSESALEKKQGSENKKENKKENKYIYKEISKSSSKFKKPTIEEIKAYCEKKGYQIDPEYFYDYYESIGWKRGKTPIKSWKHTLATWVKNQSSWEKEKEKNSAKREKKKITLDFS